MKVGDLVESHHPSWTRAERIGVIVGTGFRWTETCSNKAFNVLWRNGTIEKNVWDYDLKIIKSS